MSNMGVPAHRHLLPAPIPEIVALSNEFNMVFTILWLKIHNLSGR